MYKTAVGRVFIILFISSLSGITSAAAAESSPCLGDFFGAAEVRYDEQGRLTEVNDAIHHTRTELSYDRMFVSLSQSARTGFQNYSAEGGSRELSGPTRWSLYNSKSGRLATVHTYEDHNFSTRGVQTSWEIPGSYDLAQATNADGHVTYTGPFTQETVTYDEVKSGVRSVELTEPLNIHESRCLKVGGQNYSLRKEVRLGGGTEPAPFKSFATRVLTGEGVSAPAGRNSFESGRFATKVIGGGSALAEDGSSSISWASGAN